ncbi:MAG: DUF5071 domain-containing protein [Anaerolineae bacterium]|nr:DUF5071 domain-containing protein [Anaerolineae bacterium]
MSRMLSEFDKLSRVYSDVGGVDNVPRELLHLLPRNKCDCDRMEEIEAIGMPGVQPILLHLLMWLQDKNWPVSYPMTQFLQTVGEPLVDPVRFVLHSDDSIWKHWVLLDIVEHWEHKLRLRILADLRQIAESPTPDDESENLPEIAKEIIAKTES